MISHEEFIKRLRDNHYNNATAAKRATGRVKLTKAQKTEVGDIIDKHFGGAPKPARAPKAEKAPRAAKAAPAKRASKGKPRLVSGKQWLARLKKGKYPDAQSARDAVSKFSHWTSGELDRANELIEQWAADPHYIRVATFSPRKVQTTTVVPESSIKATVNQALQIGKAQTKLQHLLSASVVADHLSAGLATLQPHLDGDIAPVAAQLASTIERLANELSACTSVLLDGVPQLSQAPLAPPPSSNGKSEKSLDTEKVPWETPQAPAQA